MRNLGLEALFCLMALPVVQLNPSTTVHLPIGNMVIQVDGRLDQPCPYPGFDKLAEHIGLDAAVEKQAPNRINLNGTISSFPIRCLIQGLEVKSSSDLTSRGSFARQYAAVMMSYPSYSAACVDLSPLNYLAEESAGHYKDIRRQGRVIRVYDFPEIPAIYGNVLIHCGHKQSGITQLINALRFNYDYAAAMLREATDHP